MRCRPGLRLRLWLGASALALLALGAAGLAGFGMARTSALAEEAMAAQHRIEAYGAYSTRVNGWLLGWLAPTGPEPPNAARVMAALDELDRLVAEDAAAQGGAAPRGQAATAAQLRGRFEGLERQLMLTPPGTPEGEAAIALFTMQVPSMIGERVAEDTRRREAAMGAMERLRRRLYGAVAAVAVATPLVLLALYLLLLRPLFARLRHAAASAEAMAMGGLPAGAGGHDELGLVFARLRQMAGRIDRRRLRLSRDYGRLEGIVAERTAELTVANERLSRTDSMRRRFFADVGHELRTPLTVIMGEAELGATHPDPQARASFGTIGNRAQRLFRRIEDLLRIAGSESGQLELARDRVDLAGVLAGALEDMAPVLRRAGVTAAVDLPPLAVAGDADWLRQVFAGFFDNAAKHAGKGARVGVTGRAEAGLAVIDIADDGLGLPEGADPATLFGRFARAGGPAPGFGVGLALGRWVVETLGGSLTAVASPGGLHLRLTLPLWKE